jgi:hypothetical protein
MLNVSVHSIAKAAIVRRQGAPELIEAVEQGTASVSAAEQVASLPKPRQKEIVAGGEAAIVRAANAIKRERKESKRAERTAETQAAAATVPPVTARYEIHHASCGDALRLSAQSVDFIITDPPYPREFCRCSTISPQSPHMS